MHVFSPGKVALGYALAGAVWLAYATMRLPERETDVRDPIDVDDAAERAPSNRRFAREEGGSRYRRDPVAVPLMA